MASSEKIGICTGSSERCEKAKTQERQTVPASQFKCPECSFNLRPLNEKSSYPPWLIAALIALVVLFGGAYLAYRAFTGPTGLACTDGDLATFLAGNPSPDQLLQAAAVCRDSAKTADAAKGVAQAARLCRSAADAGKAEGLLCLGELYDPKDWQPGRTGQMPVPDITLAFDNYRRALQFGNSVAQQRLAELKPLVETKAQQGDAQARRLLEQWPSR